ncbi:MAG: hypothetical protein Q7R85_02400 [bacterium]|nr:hypothetical protein [bacterium]
MMYVIPTIVPERHPPDFIALVRFTRRGRLEVGVFVGMSADGLVDILRPVSNSETGKMELGTLRRLDQVEIFPL